MTFLPPIQTSRHISPLTSPHLTEPSSSPDGTQQLVVAVLHEAQLSGVEDHAAVGVLEEELLAAAVVHPGDLGEQVPGEVANQERFRGAGHKVSLLA